MPQSTKSKAANMKSTKDMQPMSTKRKMAGPPRLSTADQKTLKAILAKGAGSDITDKQRELAKKLLRKKGVKK